MKAALLTMLLAGVVAAGLAFYWHSTTSEVLTHVEKNLATAQKNLADAGEGVTLRWDRIERHAFPLGKGVRIIRPVLEHKAYGRTQSVTLEYLDVLPRSDDMSRIQLEGPLKALAKDASAEEFTLTYAAFPSVMFRTPAEEKTLPENSRSFMGDTRTTPANVLAALPEDQMHQYSIVMPAKFSLTITTSGAKRTTEPFAAAKVALRQWRPIDYRLAGNLDALFSYINSQAHAR